MNVAPATSDPRAARRTSCLGTFLLVLVLWSFSVVALATYLITRSAIVRQVRFAWWAVFLAAAALLGVEVAVFEATGNGLADLLRLHIHPWWLLAHGYGIGSLVTWPLTILACQAPLSLPVGAMVGSLSVARGERLAAGAEWSAYSQRQALVAEVHAVRRSPGPPAATTTPPTPPGPQRWASPIPAATSTPGCASAAGSPRSSSPSASSAWPWPCSASPARARPTPCCDGSGSPQGPACASSSSTAKGPTPGWPGRSPVPTGSPTPAPSSGSGPPNPSTAGAGTAWPSPTASWPWRTGPAKVAASTTGGWPPWPSSSPAPHPPAHPETARTFCAASTSRNSRQLWRGDVTAQADLEQLAADPQVLAGVRGRYSAFFRALAGTADGCWALEDVDLAVLTIPTIASRTDADAAVRLVLEDLGHFATKRKARVGDDVLLVLDEFSAVQGGTDQAIHLAERLRDVGVPVVFGAQSPEGLGDERQQWRLLHTIGGGLVLHQLADPDLLVGLAGTVRTPEQAWQLDAWGPAGQARVHMADRPRVDPNQVRQLHPGEAFLIQAGRAVKLSVLQAPVPAQVQEEASALRATAMSAAEPVYVAEGIVGPPPQVELWRPSQPALDQPDLAPLPALAAPSDDGQATEPVPALPATPRPRILLALRRAVAARDEATIAAVIQTGRREEPDWDPTEELQRLGAVGRWRRWRRRPSFPRWLARVAHLGRVRHG